MRKSLQSLVMLFMASSLMPLMARPHCKPHFKHHKDIVIVQHGCAPSYGHPVSYHGCKPYASDYSYGHSPYCRCRRPRPLVNVYQAPVVHHYEPKWGHDVMVVRPRPRLDVTVNF